MLGRLQNLEYRVTRLEEEVLKANDRFNALCKMIAESQQEAEPDPDVAREHALRAYLEGLTDDDKAGLVAGAGSAMSAALKIIEDHGYTNYDQSMVEGVVRILTVDPKVVVCAPDPACQSLDDTREGGTHLECPTKGGA